MKAENVSINLICIASLASVVVIPRTTNVTPAVIVVSIVNEKVKIQSLRMSY